MSRYIDADAFIKEVVKIQDLRRLSTATIGEALDRTPTADVVEVKRGEWLFGKQIDGAYDVYGIKSGSILCRCSKCNFAHVFIDGHSSQYHFCPNCGADMRGKQND